MSDKISPKTPDIVSDTETPWGEIGYVVYKRTYSRRLKDDDLGGQTEEYIDTVNRIIRACRKQLDVGFTPEEEAEVAEILLSLKGTVAGRFFWQLGTKTVDKLGLLSLQNCAACVVDDPVRPFLWTFDALMLGCGVGYNLQRENVYKLPKVKKKKIKIERLDVKDADFIVPDSREGWVKLLGRVLKAYFYSGEGFTYSTLLIRGKGTAIKGFGGIASGPEDLVSGIASICNVLDSRRGKQLRPIDCLDIMNIIGSIVVSGNVRRCLPEGSLVHTKRGLIPVEKVIPGQDAALTSEGYKPIVNKFDQGTQETIVINTQDGQFECTPNHKMKVATKSGPVWVLAKDLQSGDRLISPRVETEGVKTQMPSTPLVTAPELDEGMAWLIGYTQADGVFVNDLSVITKAKQQIERFGKEAEIHADKNGLCLHTEAASIFYLLAHTNKMHNEPTRTPDWILQATPEIRKAYVAGIIDKNKAIDDTSTIATKDKKFAQDIQSVLYSCGIESQFAAQGKNYTVNLASPYSRHKMSQCPQLMTSLGDSTDALCDSGDTWTSTAVVDIKPGRSVPTWDIEVEDMHEFYCNGYLTHNSAAISIGDYDDLDFLNAKNWGEGNIPNWRAMSNNSVVCNDISKLPPQFWDTYHGNSEPYGLINLRLSREIGRTGETQYPDPEVQAYNPCVVGETEILTRDGYVRIDSVVDQPVEVWNGFEWSQVAPKITGHNQRLLTIKFSDGRELTCTRYHKFHLNNGLVVEAQKLKIDDALIEHTYPTLIEQINNARKVYLPWGEVSLEKDSELRWSVDELKKAQAILSTMGVQSHFDGHVLSVKKRDNAPHGVHVVSIADAGVANTVYCFNEPKRHLGIFNGVITGQCAEQSLAPYETCCLAEVHLPNITSKEELLKVAKYLYRINKHSLLLPCHHPETEAIVHKNMRMGIGITGYLMATDEQQSWLSDTYLALRAYDAEYSKQHGFPPSIKITTVKPSGTLSLLSGVTSGAHPGYSHYFIRRVRMASNIPLVDVCRNKGYHVEYERNFDNTENRNTVVVSFPCSLPEHTKLAKDMSAIDQLEVVAKLQREWSDNAVSVTVYYRKEELSLIQGWLLENFNDRIKSVSFLLHSDHGFQQAPLEEITKEQYEEMSSKVDQITSLASIEESSVSSDGLGCETGACPLK